MTWTNCDHLQKVETSWLTVVVVAGSVGFKLHEPPPKKDGEAAEDKGSDSEESLSESEDATSEDEDEGDDDWGPFTQTLTSGDTGGIQGKSLHLHQPFITPVNME